MRRVVVTGLGIVSSIGNNAAEVTESLRERQIRHQPSRTTFAEHGFKCQVWGSRSSISDRHGRSPRHALPVAGRRSGTTSPCSRRSPIRALPRKATIRQRAHRHHHGLGRPVDARTIVEAAEITAKNGSPKRIGPFAVPKAMSSTASATLATWFKIHGVNYSISSACSTSAHCIGNAAEMIQWGKQDVMFAGGHEDLDWSMSNLFDAMGAMSSKYNDDARHAPRAPMTSNRDGFVIAGGAGVLVLEELEHAKARGAKIYAELIGYGATSDGYDMVAPSGEGAVALHEARRLSTVKGRGRLHQHPRHLDAGRRQQGNRRDPRSLRRQDAAHPVDQVADRPFAGRGRRAGSDLLRS